MRSRSVELPEPVLEIALTRLTGAEGAAREGTLVELVTAHPEHAEALRALSRELEETDRLLARSFAPVVAPDPDRIGPYRVLRRLGEGAFGVVYLCAQDEPIHRQVAVKVARPGAGDLGALSRFEAERQVLVGFDHPGIAGLIDAGALPDGRPYFTMEYVDGVPITDYCDQNRLPIDARLRLCASLCDGVAHAHAHARGVVHRDLKPANVLVVERDGKPVPKIIDFGIAKALHPPEQRGVSATTLGRVIGTPGYMSPEQASGNPQEVDARADVFSLGVILYELLVGDLPWGSRIPSTDTEPPRPSTRVQTDRPRSTAIAGMRSTEIRALVSKLRGELDWVVLKALQVTRELRYQSARELADDVLRHLQGEPVRAGPPSVASRLRKVMRRHRVKVAVTSAVLVLGAVGAAVSFMFRSDALAIAAARLSDTDAAVRKLVLRAFDPRLQDASIGDEMRRDLLRDALALHDRVLRERSEHPEHRYLRVQILNHLAEHHFFFAQYQSSLELSTESGREAEALLCLHPDRARYRAARAAAERNLGRCSIVLGNREEAVSWNAKAVAALEVLWSEDSGLHSTLLAKTLLERASVLHLSGDADGELEAQNRAIDILRQRLRSQPDHAESQRDLVRSLCGLGGMLQRRGRIEEAEETILEAREVSQSSSGISDEERLIVSRRLGIFYASVSRAGEAVAELSSAVALTERVLQQHGGRKLLRSQLREMRTLLYEQLYRLGRYEEADREAPLAIADGEALAPDYPDWQALLADTLSRLSWAATAARRDVPVDDWLERCLDLTDAIRSSDEFGKTAHRRALATRRFASIRDHLRHGRLAEAKSALSFAAKLHDPEQLFYASCCFAEIAGRQADPEDNEAREGAEAAALDVLTRALDHGFRDRQRLLASPELKVLHERPEFQRLLERLPD